MPIRSKSGVAAALALALLSAACTATEVQSSQAALAASVGAVQAACADALAAGTLASVSAKGGAANTVASINTYVAAACPTVEAVAALAQNSSSLAWLGEQTGALKALAAAAKPATP